MRKLPKDFHFHKYGIDVRFVEMDDVDFILSLRADRHLTRFIHQVENDLEAQKNWLKEYKQREEEGTDYYFIYSKDGKPFGLNRIYGITENSCTGGSWLCVPGTQMEDVIASALINRDIMFDALGLKEDNFDVRKNNYKVQRFHRMLGAVTTGETELDILFTLTREDYEKGKAKILKLLNIAE